MEADLTPPSGERYRRLSLWWDGLSGESPAWAVGELEEERVLAGGDVLVEKSVRRGLYSRVLLDSGDAGDGESPGMISGWPGSPSYASPSPCQL